MTMRVQESQPVRLHITNVYGLGAVQLVKSLLPSLETAPGFRVEEIYLPDRGELKSYESVHADTVATPYRRYVPNLVSRLIECIFLSGRFDGSTPLLVLGDIPSNLPRSEEHTSEL